MMAINHYNIIIITIGSQQNILVGTSKFFSSESFNCIYLFRPHPQILLSFLIAITERYPA